MQLIIFFILLCGNKEKNKNKIKQTESKKKKKLSGEREINIVRKLI